MAEQFMSADETDRYIDERVKKTLAQRPKVGPLRRLGQMVGNVVIIALIALVALVFALVARLQYGVPVPLPASLVATAGVVYSTSVAPPRNSPALPPQRPVAAQEGGAPALVPFWGSPVVEEPTPAPTLTVPAAPTPTPGFWTPEEETQVAATATAFIEIIPTAPPAFVGYVDERCKDPELVAQSALLQAWCPKGG